jgi:hypothetical protein
VDLEILVTGHYYEKQKRRERKRLMIQLLGVQKEMRCHLSTGR